MVIDCHTHVLDTGFWPQEWFEWVALDWASKSPGRVPAQIQERIESGLIDPSGDQMIDAMDAAGVDHAVVLPLDWGPAFRERVPIAAINEHAAVIGKRHGGRLIPFVGVDPRRKEAAELVERGLRDGGAKGVKLYPPAGFDPFDPSAHPLYELCIQYRVPVLFHTGETLPKLSLRYAQPMLLQDVFAAFPQLISWIGHAGARLWWAEALSVASHSINSYLELSVWITPQSTETEQRTFIRQLAEARDRLGIERLLFGSDYMSGTRVHGEGVLTEIVDFFRGIPEQAASAGVAFSDEEIAAILGLNARALLGLDV